MKFSIPKNDIKHLSSLKPTIVLTRRIFLSPCFSKIDSEKKIVLQKASYIFLNAAPIFGPSAGTDKALKIHPFRRQLVLPCTAADSYAFGVLTLKFRFSEKAEKI